MKFSLVITRFIPAYEKILIIVDERLKIDTAEFNDLGKEFQHLGWFLHPAVQHESYGTIVN